MPTSSKARPSVQYINNLQGQLNMLHYFKNIFEGALSDGEMHFGGDHNNKSKTGVFIFMKSSPGFAVMSEGISTALKDQLINIGNEFARIGVEPNPYVPSKD